MFRRIHFISTGSMQLILPVSFVFQEKEGAKKKRNKEGKQSITKSLPSFLPSIKSSNDALFSDITQTPLFNEVDCLREKT